ncbi:sigma-70 family RNA polymerase sigma factor [Chiayiivirga flava]|uniref:RNA polymerase sigma-70 factor (ECF subfamily) n=1 Tax=Chiayiivirga flava TaxID=659595 RepID=A0A7W8D7A3_9GAMM|nr:RNA polymerase sigma-70 factor (ECF subfamily) [Chiayiivirga flava]
MPDPGVRLNQLLDRFTARVRAQIESNRLFQHGIEVDDVVQEVRIRLWKALERDPNADFPASYIQKVVATTVVDSIRRAQVRAAEPMPDAEDGAAEFPDRAPEPDHAAVDAQQVAHVAACIAQLSPRRRRPLQLYLQGFQLQEIADLSGLTLDAARKLVYRGLDEVKERLRALGME